MSEPPQNVTACLLIIGNEILSGRTKDANLNFLALELNKLGVRLRECRVIPDVEETVVATVNEVRVKFDYVFTTGGIGPTHDDITADCIALAFGVKLFEHPEIIEMMTARWGGELTPARRRMARVPEGGDLLKNPVAGPPGFTIGNVFVMAGVPQIMRGMLEDVGWRLKGGAIVLSRNVRVDGSGEGVIAEPLERVAKAHPDMSLGSYPFFGPDGYGSNLVLRGRDPAELNTTVDELVAALTAAGIGTITVDEPGAKT